MIITASNVNSLSFQTKLTWNKSTSCGALNNTTCQLVLFTSTPGVDFALLVKSKNMVCACGKCNNLFQLRDEYWSVLDVFQKSEAKNAIVSLRCVSKCIVIIANSLLGMFPSHKPNPLQ